MIWELMKRDPAWQVMPVVALIVTASVLFAPSRSGGEAFVIALPFILLIGVPGFRQRSTLLQATLPIAGKQLFLSRIASLMACNWLPIFAAVTVAMALRSDRTWADYLPLLEAGAVISVALLLVQCVRVQTINAPAWLAVIVTGGMVFPLVLIGELVPRSVAAIIAVLGGCTLASAALVLKAWTAVPRSFQLAPAKPVSAESDKGRQALPTATWWPVFHSLYGGWQAGVWLFGSFFVMFLGVSGSASLMLMAFFLPCRRGMRWLLHLPISARRLFWAVWLPITAAMVVGFVLNIPFEVLTKWPDVSLRTRIIAFTVVVLSWLIQICALQLQGWKRVRNIPLSVRSIFSVAPSYAIFVTPAFLQIAGKTIGRNFLYDRLARSLGIVLPDNLWMIALIALLPVAGLYWLAEKLFREMEFGQIETMAQRTSGGRS